MRSGSGAEAATASELTDLSEAQDASALSVLYEGVGSATASELKGLSEAHDLSALSVLYEGVGSRTGGPSSTTCEACLRGDGPVAVADEDGGESSLGELVL